MNLAQLSKREKTLILGLGVLIVLSVIYFILSGMAGYSEELKRRSISMEQLLVKTKALALNLNEQGPQTTKRGPKKSLIERIELLAGDSNLKEKLQLNRVPLDKNKGVEGIEIKMDGLSLDELVHFMYSIENSRPQIIVDQIELTSSFRGKGRLRLSMRVLAQL